MTRQPSPTPDTPTSWMGFKDLARRHYERGDYEAALSSYTSALSPDMNCPGTEKQILLSNMVACRLKIGGPAQARAAIQNAKDCIALNPNFAKGHVRLASAYIALGGHSNDACNELQRALSLDPGNSTARDMLVRELRRDHAHASAARSENSNSNGNGSHPNNNDTGPDFYTDPPRDNNAQAAGHHVDDSLSWWDRLQFHWGRASSWYENQSSDAKTVFKILLVLLVLYVGFGGRFGFEEPRQLGNYGADSAYDQYRKYGTTTGTHSSQSSYPYNHQQTGSSSRRRTSSSSSSHYQDEDYYDDTSYYNSRPARGGSSWGGGFNPLDGGMQSMMLIGGLMYAGQRMGLNPFHTMMIMNALGGGRQRFRPRGGFGMGGFGRGMGGMGGFGRGMGGGFGRRRY